MNEYDEALVDTQDLNESLKQDSIDYASESVDNDDLQEQEQSQQIETPTQLTPKEQIAFDPERPYSFADSMQEQNRLLGVLSDKLQKINHKELSGEMQGVFYDFKLELENLAQETQKIINFFSTEIPQEDKELINRATLLKNNLVALYDVLKNLNNADYERQIGDVNNKLRRFMKSTHERIESYDDNIKGKFSANLKHLSDLLQEFYKRELNATANFSEENQKLIADSHQKFKEISNDFELTSKKLKIFGFAILMAFIALGVCFGVLSSVTYRKYTEYSEIESKMASLSKRIESVVIRKDKNNNVIFQIPKENTRFKENQKLYEITIKEVR